MKKASKGPTSGTSGNALAANVLVGVGLGWVAQHYFPRLAPWGYIAGILLGFASGLWQVLKQDVMIALAEAKGKAAEKDANRP